MNTENKSSNTEFASAAFSGRARVQLSAACLAVLCVATMAGAQNAPMAVPANLAASSMEGRVIVAFDSPAQRTSSDRYRVYCSAVGGLAPAGQVDASKSPAVIVGLAVGKAYDCRASAMSARGASNDSKPVRVRVMGAD